MKALARSLRAVLVGEDADFPFIAFRRTAIIRLLDWINAHVTYRLLDGTIVISTMLQDYFTARFRKSAEVLRVPIMVDTAAYARPDGQPAAGTGRADRRIVYCGNLRNDGEIAGLLRVFSLIAGDFPASRLQIVGELLDDRRMAEFHGLIASLGLSARVEFTGLRPQAEIPAILSQGDVMVLPRAAGTFSTAGFPTKLAEYLASGKPVIVTSTGDIPKYLQDGVDAFLAPPGDTEAFAGRLRHVLAHPGEAAEVRPPRPADRRDPLRHPRAKPAHR